jgi:alpha-tubulin suppressor-like RCC1 family protein
MRRFSPLTATVLLCLLLLSSACQRASAVKASVIAAGGNQTCILDSGGAKCWGRNNAGQLGDGTMQDRSEPVAVTVLPDTLTAVAVGYTHACALTESKEIFCWGSNPADQARISVKGGFTAVTTGSMHTCALTASGGVMCWGVNSFGALGDGTTEDRTSPVEVDGLSGDVTAVAAGVDFTCAVQKGAVKCWGSNDTGQLGNGSYASSSTPVAVPGLESGVTAVAAGVFHACALKDGEVWCWGENLAGALGDGTNQNSPVPVKVAGLEEGVRSIVVGGSHTCALTKAGGVKCWGGNASGQVGDGSTTDRNAPADVVGLTEGVIAVAAGGSHSCAVLEGGAVKCWGLNDNGQLGNGGTTGSNVPVDVRL